MNKELQKLLKQINDKKNEVKSLVNDGKLDKAKAAKEELKELQNRFDLLYDLDEDEQGSIEDKVNKGTAKQVGGEKKVDKKNLVKAFVNIVKAGFLPLHFGHALRLRLSICPQSLQTVFGMLNVK